MTSLLPSTSPPLYGRTITGRTIYLASAPFMKINTITPMIMGLFNHFDLIFSVFNHPACNGPALMRVRVKSGFEVLTVALSVT